MLATCRGGIAVASKTCMRLFAASETQSSFSSGVRPMPWLGQPCRLIGPCLYPWTSTRWSILPVVRSPTSKPSRPLTFTKQRVCAPLTVNGRMRCAEGPDGPRRRVARRVGDRQQGRLQAGQVGVLAVEPVDRVVGPRMGDDLRDHVAVEGVDDVPVVASPARGGRSPSRRARSPSGRTRLDRPAPRGPSPSRGRGR